MHSEKQEERPEKENVGYGARFRCSIKSSLVLVHYYIGERLKLKRESVTESLDRAPGENVVITLMRFADNEKTLV